MLIVMTKTALQEQKKSHILEVIGDIDMLKLYQKKAINIIENYQSVIIAAKK